MHLETGGVRLALALLVIAHGFAHTILLNTGLLAPDLLQHDFMPAILTGVAVLGFTVAGVGLAVTPVLYAVRPLLVLAAAYSLVAIWRMGADNAWLGVLVDVTLLLIGLTAAYRYLPQRRQLLPH